MQADHRFCHHCGVSLYGVTPLAPPPPPPPAASSVAPLVAAPAEQSVDTVTVGDPDLLGLVPRTVPLVYHPPPTVPPIQPLLPITPGTLPDAPVVRPPRSTDDWPILPVGAGAPTVPIDEIPPNVGSRGDSTADVATQVPITEPVPVVQAWDARTTTGSTSPSASWSPAARGGDTDVQPITVVPNEPQASPPPRPIGVGVVLLVILSALTTAGAIAAVVVEAVAWDVTGSARVSASLLFDDLSTAHSVGVAIGAVLLAAGAVIAAAGRRVGAGVAGGAALALAGTLANAVGLGLAAIDAAEHRYLAQPGTTITSTRGVGVVLAIAVAALAAVTAIVAMTLIGGARPAVGVIVLGVIGSVAAGVGPLIPVGGATWSDNLDWASVPPATLALRIAPLVLTLAGGVVGFLVGGRAGGAVVVGSASVAVYTTVMALVGSVWSPLVDAPPEGAVAAVSGHGIGNLVDADGSWFVTEPHLVTVVGLATMTLLGLIAMVVRRRPAREF